MTVPTEKYRNLAAELTTTSVEGLRKLSPDMQAFALVVIAQLKAVVYTAIADIQDAKLEMVQDNKISEIAADVFKVTANPGDDMESRVVHNVYNYYGEQKKPDPQNPAKTNHK